MRWALLGCALLLAACGQKGPLYFPEPASAPQASADPATDDDNEQKADADQAP